ncbi:MAG: acetate--CoA ligase family protein [Acidimicrobiia bacterium]|nr:acetate--CoA ligase family protein [Acidimicrobiia bacterium]
MTADHRLTPLLAPRSVALVGASREPTKPGNEMVREMVFGGFSGPIYPVNPRHEEVEGLPCHPSLSDVPGPVDLAVLAVPNRDLEARLVEAIETGVRAAVIFGSVALEDDEDPPLRERIRAIARDADMPVCGGNCMGFYNLEADVRAYPFHLPEPLQRGGVSFFSHSGSSLSALLWNERRLGFNLAVSPGQELVTTVADYLDYALDQSSTTAVLMLLETVRDPERFVAGLERAADQDVPVIVLKTGRTEESAAMALSHSGAIVGDDAAYDALFERHGVTRVSDLDEMTAAALLLAQPRRPAAGGLAAIFDSGGERELLLDAAADAGVRFARVSPETTRVLVDTLDHGLPPVNPLDAWGTGRNYREIFETSWQALMDDPDTAMGLFVADLTDGFHLHEAFAEICRRVASNTDKPVGFMTNHAGGTHHRMAMDLTREGVPVLDGLTNAMAAVRHVLDRRDHRSREPDPPPPAPDDGTVRRWRDRLRSGDVLMEDESLALLDDFGIPTVARRVVTSAADAVEAAEAVGLPVVLKTAAPGVVHKTDVGGVALGLTTSEAVAAAYDEMADRLGPRALVAAMAEGTVEVALGVVQDEQFGPLVMVAAGGVFVELLHDSRVAMPPFGRATARRVIDRLAIRPAFDGLRGSPPADLEALAAAYANLSVLAIELGDAVAELDVNPVLVGAEGAVAVDALVVPA